MNKEKRKIRDCLLMIISVVVLFSITLFNLFIFFNNVKWLNILLYSIIFLLIALSIFGYLSKKEVYVKLSVVASVILMLVYIIYFLLVKTNLINQISSFDDLKQLILSFGGWGILTYIIINLLQCIIIPIPTTLTVLVGTAIYGPLVACIYATIGVILGSSIAFCIGRYCSRPVINWIFGKEKVDKYQSVLSNRTGLLLFITLALPFFPDDLICMLAGVTNIKYIKFLAISIIARGVGLATISFLGSGQIIPFSGWGIAVWVALGIGLIGLLIFIFKKRNSIKNFFKANTNRS